MSAASIQSSDLPFLGASTRRRLESARTGSSKRDVATCSLSLFEPPLSLDSIKNQTLTWPIRADRTAAAMAAEPNRFTGSAGAAATTTAATIDEWLQTSRSCCWC